MSECIFCKIANKEMKSSIVYEDDGIVVFKDIEPQAPVHLLIIPKKHIGGLTELDKADELLIGRIVGLSKTLAERFSFSQCGFRLYAGRILPFLATKADRFAADSETLLRLALNNIHIGSVPISVIYGDEKSKIRPFRDTIRVFAMTRRLKRENLPIRSLNHPRRIILLPVHVINWE